MKVKVRDGFPAIGAVIDDEAIAGFFEMALAGDPLGGGEKVGKDGVILGGNGAVAGVMFFGNEKDMDGGLGGEIAEGENVIVLVHDIGGHLAIDDALENGFGHRANYQMVSSRREGLRVRARARMKWTISSFRRWQEVRQDAEPVRERTQERRPSSRRTEAREEIFSSSKEAK